MHFSQDAIVCLQWCMTTSILLRFIVSLKLIISGTFMHASYFFLNLSENTYDRVALWHCLLWLQPGYILKSISPKKCLPRVFLRCKDQILFPVWFRYAVLLKQIDNFHKVYAICFLSLPFSSFHCMVPKQMRWWTFISATVAFFFLFLKHSFFTFLKMIFIWFMVEVTNCSMKNGGRRGISYRAGICSHLSFS